MRFLDMENTHEYPMLMRAPNIHNTNPKDALCYVNKNGVLVKKGKKEAKQGYLNISRATFYRLLNSGNFPEPICIGTKIKFWRKEDIDAWINEQANKK